MAQFIITVTPADGSDLLKVQTAPTAAQMEDQVTALHREFPAPAFRVNVRTT